MSDFKRYRYEYEMSGDVRAWIESRGFTPYAEVGFRGNIDFVGVREPSGDLMCIEMKRHLSLDAIKQCRRCQKVTPNVYCYVNVQPRDRGVDRAKAIGIGIICNGQIILEPVDNGSVIKECAERVLAKCRSIPPGGIAGHRHVGAVGLAMAVFVRTYDYRQSNPDATWEQTYKAVDHHYSGFLHYCSAMYAVLKAVKKKKDWKSHIDDVRERMKLGR